MGVYEFPVVHYLQAPAPELSGSASGTPPVIAAPPAAGPVGSCPTFLDRITQVRYLRTNPGQIDFGVKSDKIRDGFYWLVVAASLGWGPLSTNSTGQVNFGFYLCPESERNVEVSANGTTLTNGQIPTGILISPQLLSGSNPAPVAWGQNALGPETLPFVIPNGWFLMGATWKGFTGSPGAQLEMRLAYAEIPVSIAPPFGV